MKKSLNLKIESKYLPTFNGTKELRYTENKSSFVVTMTNFELSQAKKLLNKFYGHVRNFSEFRVCNTMLSNNEGENTIKGIYVVDHTTTNRATAKHKFFEAWKKFRNELTNSSYKSAFCPMYDTCRYKNLSTCNSCKLFSMYLPINVMVKKSVQKVARNYSIKKLDEMFINKSMKHISTITHKKSERANSTYTLYVFSYKDKFIIGLHEKAEKNNFYVFQYTGVLETINLNKFLEPVS